MESWGLIKIIFWRVFNDLIKPFTPMHANSFLCITCVIVRCLTRPLNSTVIPTICVGKKKRFVIFSTLL